MKFMPCADLLKLDQKEVEKWAGSRDKRERYIYIYIMAEEKRERGRVSKIRLILENVSTKSYFYVRLFQVLRIRLNHSSPFPKGQCFNVL